MKRKSIPTTTKLLRTLRHARDAERLSQFALGEKLGIAQSHISLIERGRADPQLSTLSNIAAALNLQFALVPRPLWPVVQSLIEDYYATANLPAHPPAPIERPLYRLADEAGEATAVLAEQEGPADERHDEPA